MKPLMMPDLFNQHTAQLSGMVANHEINRIENLKVEYIDLVNVRYTEKPDQREFTALITASARDYYVDDRSGKFLRGDKAPARFQEFWTFHRVGDRVASAGDRAGRRIRYAQGRELRRDADR